MTEDEIVGQHHRLNGHEFGQALRDGGGQGSLACCSSWGHQESDMTEQQKNNQKELSGISGNISPSCNLFEEILNKILAKSI